MSSNVQRLDVVDQGPVASRAPVPGRVPGAAHLDRFRHILIAAAATLTAAVAGLAFWVSFEAISAYVVRIGAFPADLRYAGPLLVDSFTVLATVFLLWLALAGTPLRKVWDAWYAWALIITATAASAYLNAAHVAPGAPDVARVVAGAVPVTLLGAVHLLVLLLLRLLAGRPQARPDWPIPVPETPAPEVPTPTEPPVPVQPDPDQDEGARLYQQVWNARRRAIDAGVTVTDFTVEDWRAVLHLYSESCGYCGRDDLPLSIEHRTPLSRGGQHVRSNVVPACEPCNLSKGTKTDEEWQEHREIMARAVEAGTTVRRNGWTTGKTDKVSLDRDDIARRMRANQSGRSIAIELGLSKRRYSGELLPMIREIKREQLARTNGHGGGS